MPYQQPDFLKKGDKAILVSPSGNIDTTYIDRAAGLLENWGLKPDVSKFAKNKYGRFCGTIPERLYDLQHAMDDKDCRLIFCSRGGYGAIHLLQNLHFEKIRLFPKWLVGYSDITLLHHAFLSNGIKSIHAPMAKHLSEYPDDKSSLLLKKTLFEKLPEYTLKSHPLNIPGQAEGYLLGGNLTIICSLLGSTYTLYPENTLLFIEDTGEEPYQIDRMMWSLEISGILAKLKGIIIGSFSGYKSDSGMYHPVYESIRHLVKKYTIPACFGFPVGHTTENHPLVQGNYMKLEIDKEKVYLTNI